MSNPINSLLRVIMPVILVYLAFSMFGPWIGGLIIAVLLAVGLYLNRAVIYQNKASKKYQSGNYEGALADLKNAVSYDQKAFRIRGAYAFLLLKLGYTDEAAVQIEEALNKTKQDSDKNTLLGTKALVFWKQGKIDEAISLMESLVKHFETTNVYATLGFLYIEKGDINRALEFNLQAKDFNGSNPIILDNLGSCYLLLEDYEKAFEIYQAVMKLKPNFPEAFYNYAKLLEKSGDLEKAVYMLRHSLTLRFWNTSTICKSEVESYLGILEEKLKEIELTRVADGIDSNENTNETA